MSHHSIRTDLFVSFSEPAREMVFVTMRAERADEARGAQLVARPAAIPRASIGNWAFGDLVRLTVRSPHPSINDQAARILATRAGRAVFALCAATLKRDLSVCARFATSRANLRCERAQWTVLAARLGSVGGEGPLKTGYARQSGRVEVLSGGVMHRQV